MTNKSLEEIFWKGEKWVKSNDEKIKPEPIGLPIHIINLKYKETIPKNHPVFEEDYLQSIGNGINAYSKKIYLGSKDKEYTASLQFYKI